MEILKWENISFAYEGQFQISGLSYGLQAQDFTLFFGPNGAGKTTLFRLAVALLNPSGGQVYLNGRRLKQYSSIEIARQVAFLEQEIHYSFPFTVEEIVLMGRFPHNADQFWDRKEDFEIAAWAMETAGVLKFAKRSIFQLSGGERRKVEIARALCQKPKLMLLDEPNVFLDFRQQIELFEILNRLNREEKITIGLISHQLDLAKRFVKEAVFIENGIISQVGPSREMLEPNKIEKFFGLALRSS